MSTPLLSTKLYFPPDREKYISRGRLIERLNADLWEQPAFIRKLTIVSAPAGFGKTTLVTQWLRSENFPCAWLSLDENDNDPRRFLGYLIAAIRQIDPRISNNSWALFDNPQPPPSNVVLTVLVNDIAAQNTALILAIDDYHLIQEQSIHQQLNFLLEYQPPNLHLVIMTREDPPVPISKLRAHDQVIEIRQVDLCFTEQETRAFLSKEQSLYLQDEDIQALLRRTEGWAAGLQLAALSLQGQNDTRQFIQSFTGSNRYILDYLMDEVLRGQTSSVQDFLLKTALLERFSAPLCDSICDTSESLYLLDTLESANLFIIPLDSQREWYRYHRLFAEHLRHRVRISDDINEQDLHVKASLWFEQNGYIQEAVWHAILAEDWPRADGLMLGVFQEMLKRGEVITLLGWYRRLPEQVVLQHPKLCVDFTWPLVLTGQLDAAETQLSRVEPLLREGDRLLGDIAALQAYIARSRGDTRRTILMSQRALSMMPDDEQGFRDGLAVNLGIAYWHEGQLSEAKQVFTEALGIAAVNNNRYVELTAMIFLNRIQAARGHLRQAYQAYLPLLELEGDIPILALVHLDLGALLYEFNELEECEKQIKASIAMSERTQNGEFLIGGHAQLVRLRLAQGDMAGAIKSLRETERLLQQLTITPQNRKRNAALHVQVALLQGDIAGAEAWAEQAGDGADAHNFYPFLGLAPTRILLAKNRSAETLEYLQSCYQAASSAGWGYAKVAILVMQALAAEKTDAALEFLSQALHFGEPGGLLRTFIDAGDQLLPLLQEASLRGISTEYSLKIISAMGKPTHLAVSAHASMLEPLSERELEVLRLVAAGLSNREIADRLILSLGTVKSHIHNIYGKLDARSRTQAIARARELKLL